MMCLWLMPTQKFLMLLKMLRSVFVGNSSMTFDGLATARSILYRESGIAELSPSMNRLRMIFS